MRENDLPKLSLFAIPWLLSLAALATGEEYDEALKLFYAGQYADCVAESIVYQGANEFDQDWVLLKMRAEMALGRYSDAQATLESGLFDHSNSLRIRLAGEEVCRYNQQIDRSFELLQEIQELYDRSAWRFRDALNQIDYAKYLLTQGLDAKEVLDQVLGRVKNNYPNEHQVYAAIGELGLSKNEMGLAADNFRKAIELEPGNPDYHFKLHQATSTGDRQTAEDALEKTLELNPNFIPALLAVAENQVDGEIYEQAEKTIEQIFEINPHQPAAWSLKAIIAHLQNDLDEEQRCRAKALEHWQFNPQVDYLIGKKLSRKYRFVAGEAYQRRALIFDPDFQPARIQLAQDVLRLGREREGWELAERVFESDNYNVVAHNLVTLRDQIEKFETIKRKNFVVRMDPLEAKLYGDRVLDLLVRASELLESKYKIDIRTPVIVEIFSKQQDFAIRTFGTPGGDGFLGVCFGNVVTMNSPSAQGANLTSWESVLWHEFCHVVTLQKTKNKMPRWLSEGISVYEERLADSAWGQSMNLDYRDMIEDGDLTPISELSNAFLKPESGAHLQFAYYQSSMVVEFLIQEHGLQTLVRVLDDLAVGMPINESLARYTGSLELLNQEFEQYIRGKADELVAKGNWDKPEFEETPDAATLLQFAAENPDNVFALQLKARTQLEAKLWNDAKASCLKLLELGYNFPGERNPHLMLAEIYQATDDKPNQIQSLQSYLQVDADATQPMVQLMEIYRGDQDWASLIKVAQRYLAVNPIISVPHRYLADAGVATGNHQLAISGLTALTELDPGDPAGIYFQLAGAHFALNEVPVAKRFVLKSIEEAPRYQEAHELLLQILKREKETSSAGDETGKSLQKQ